MSEDERREESLAADVAATADTGLAAGHAIEEAQLRDLLDFSFRDLRILNRRVLDGGALACS